MAFMETTVQEISEVKVVPGLDKIFETRVAGEIRFRNAQHGYPIGDTHTGSAEV